MAVYPDISPQHITGTRISSLQDSTDRRLNLILATGLSPGTRTIVNKNPFGVEIKTDKAVREHGVASLSLVFAEVIVVLRLAQPR